MTNAKGPEAGSLTASVISFEEAAVGRRSSSPKNPRGEGPALITPFETFEARALERISAAEFLDGLTTVTERRALYWCAEPEENIAKLKAIESIEDLLAQAKLGITTGIFSLTPDSKREIQSVFRKIGFTPEEVNIFNIKRAAAERAAAKGIDDYLPWWAVFRVKQRLAEDKEYASKISSRAEYLHAMLEEENDYGVKMGQEAWEDALDFAIEAEARGFLESVLERTRGLLQGQERQNIDSQIKEELQFNSPQSRDRLIFLYRYRRQLIEEERLKPLNEEELISGLNEIANKLEEVA